MNPEKDFVPKSGAELSQIPKVYINSAQVNFSYFDIQLSLYNGSIINSGDRTEVLMEPKLIAQMSPQHFKVLINILNEQLKNYEQQYGVIQLPQPEPKSEK